MLYLRLLLIFITLVVSAMLLLALLPIRLLATLVELAFDYLSNVLDDMYQQLREIADNE